MKIQERRARERGFTLIEMLVVLVILGIAALISIPYLSAQIQRSKLLGVTSQVSGLMRLARLDAIKYSRCGMVAINLSTRKVNAFSDKDGDCQPDAGEEIGEVILPKSVIFGAPGNVCNLTGVATYQGFSPWAGNPNVATFNSDGSIKDSTGAFCFKSEALGTGAPNYLEVQVAPQATARVAMLKYESGAWVENDGTGVWKWN
ncbi:MAG TPA: prepilin-type N-terminal cleavage/methylation domain-containing protein [Thermoanaerobaculia bacterium]|jgi:prepilin-type N-terminal cleavage/methylation domain-containing protein|nr:prepilin-type N-terminal cleavage/methylation domain-containing protein [Thermoanaerobaculia bacterium]